MANNIIKGYALKRGQSLAASFQLTELINIRTIDRLFINIATTGVTDNTGEFFVQSRIVQDDNNYSAWSTLDLTPEAVLNNANANMTLILDPPPVGQIRITFVAAGGTPNGSCDIWVSGASTGGR